jgi:hypothetical protein
MVRKNSTGRASIKRAFRQEQALKLRLAGATYTAIAEKLGCSRTVAYRDVADALAELKREPAQAVLDMEMHRLDQMLLGLWRDAVSGNTKAVSAALRIMDRRARYLGLDQAPPPDTSLEARVALDELQKAIVEAAEKINPDLGYGSAGALG